MQYSVKNTKLQTLKTKNNERTLILIKLNFKNYLKYLGNFIKMLLLKGIKLNNIVKKYKRELEFNKVSIILRTQCTWFQTHCIF